MSVFVGNGFLKSSGVSGVHGNIAAAAGGAVTQQQQRRTPTASSPSTHRPLQPKQDFLPAVGLRGSLQEIYTKRGILDGEGEDNEYHCSSRKRSKRSFASSKDAIRSLVELRPCIRSNSCSSSSGTADHAKGLEKRNPTQGNPVGKDLPESKDNKTEGGEAATQNLDEALLNKDQHPPKEKDMTLLEQREKECQEELEGIERARQQVFKDEIQTSWGAYKYALQCVLALQNLSAAPDAILPGNF